VSAVVAAAGTPTGPGLRLTGASYRYAGSGRPSLVDVSLTVLPGRVVGVAGANESGKTTLCLVASGLAPASIGGRLEGSVLVDGIETAGQAPHRLAQLCGMLFQNSLTQLSGATATVFEEVVRWALGVVAIEGLASRDPARLSGGQGQLVALASVLALRPRYLILDEPTSELDPAGTRLVAEALMRVAAETGAGILLVEHKLDVLAAVADEVVVLDGGQVALAGEAAAVLADERLPGLGVEPPARVRLASAVRAAGLEWSAEMAEATR
jgi:energy-coupling factor transporter ATP-binding protein EcfA2